MTDPVTEFVIDPPWPKKKGGRRAVRPNQGRDLDYPTMPVGEVFRLLDRDVFPTGAGDHNVFLWSVDQFLSAGELEMARRGYRVHARIVWDKGTGPAPAFTVRYSHEYVTWLYRGKFRPVDRAARGRFATVLSARPRQHSRKPDAFYHMVEALYPSGVRVDVFSRERRPGWLQYGNETDRFTTGGGGDGDD